MKARDNPFAMDRLARIGYRFRGDSWDSVLARLETMSRRGAIVGPHGAGKSTLLEELQRRLLERGIPGRLFRMHQNERAQDTRDFWSWLDDLEPGETILLDGAEQLGWFGWRRFLSRSRNAHGIIITTHRPGRLSTLIECRPDSALLRQLVTELMQFQSAQRGAMEASFRPEWVAELETLFAQCDGNMREVFRYLYDRCAHDECLTEADSDGLPDFDVRREPCGIQRLPRL